MVSAKKTINREIYIDTYGKQQIEVKNFQK